MSWFRLNVKKVLEKLPNPSPPTGAPSDRIDFNESQLAMIEGLENNRFWVHISARRTGKSLGAAAIAMLKLLEPNQKVIIIAPNYNLSSIIWDYVTKMIERLQLETKRFTVKDHVVELINGSIFRLLSAANRESLVGRDANLVIVDEAGLIAKDEYFQREVRPILSTDPNSRCLFISTPRGKQHYLYRYFLRGEDSNFPDWGSGLYTWRANKYLSESDIAEAEKAMLPSVFAQEYMCSWTSTEGKIYNISDENRFPSDILPGDNRFNFIAGLDVGFRDLTAFCVVAIKDDTFYVVDEFITKEQTTSTIAEMIKNMVEKWDIEQMFIDSAAAQMKNDFAFEYDLFFQNASKQVNEGISYVQNLLQHRRLFIAYSCRETYNSLDGYIWNTKTGITEKPTHNQFSHMCDALRYALYSYYKSQISIHSYS